MAAIFESSKYSTHNTMEKNKQRISFAAGTNFDEKNSNSRLFMTSGFYFKIMNYPRRRAKSQLTKPQTPIPWQSQGNKSVKQGNRAHPKILHSEFKYSANRKQIDPSPLAKTIDGFSEKSEETKIGDEKTKSEEETSVKQNETTSGEVMQKLVVSVENAIALSMEEELNRKPSDLNKLTTNTNFNNSRAISPHTFDNDEIKQTVRVDQGAKITNEEIKNKKDDESTEPEYFTESTLFRQGLNSLPDVPSIKRSSLSAHSMRKNYFINTTKDNGTDRNNDNRDHNSILSNYPIIQLLPKVMLVKKDQENLQSVKYLNFTSNEKLKKYRYVFQDKLFQRNKTEAEIYTEKRFLPNVGLNNTIGARKNFNLCHSNYSMNESRNITKKVLFSCSRLMKSTKENTHNQLDEIIVRKPPFQTSQSAPIPKTFARLPQSIDKGRQRSHKDSPRSSTLKPSRKNSVKTDTTPCQYMFYMDQSFVAEDSQPLIHSLTSPTIDNYNQEE